MLKKFHFAVGFLFLLVFLATGVYMVFNFPGLYQGREEIRMMYRSTHIYILFAASVNLLVGYGLNCFKNFLAKIQLLASILLLVSPFLVFIGYLVEPPSYLIDRPVSYWGIVFLFIGVVLVTLLNLPWAKRFAS